MPRKCCGIPTGGPICGGPCAGPWFDPGRGGTGVCGLESPPPPPLPPDVGGPFCCVSVGFCGCGDDEVGDDGCGGCCGCCKTPFPPPSRQLPTSEEKNTRLSRPNHISKVLTVLTDLKTTLTKQAVKKGRR